MKKLPFEIVNLAARQGRCTLRAPLSTPPVIEPPRANGRAMDALEGADVVDPSRSMSLLAPDQPVFERAADVTPQEGDYVYPRFRALSQTLIGGYYLDFTTSGVLEDSVGMLMGQTVYADHWFWSVDGWLGVVSEAAWDAEGAQSEGVPGINVELKIDALLNPRIARGLMMTPPAIHSVSVTVLFEFEFSHPQLVEENRFWNLLGEEVDGEIVRLIVTKILAYWELSLVFQGADRLAKQHPQPAADDDQEVEVEPAGLNAAPANPPAPATTTEVTMGLKITRELKAKLGLPADTDDEVAEATFETAIGTLSSQAAAGKVLLDGARAECKRQATLAIVGSGEGELSPAIAKMIDQADAESVQALTAEYAKQAAARLTRSSVESTAGQPDSRPAAPVRDTTLL